VTESKRNRGRRGRALGTPKKEEKKAAGDVTRNKKYIVLIIPAHKCFYFIYFPNPEGIWVCHESIQGNNMEQ